MNYNTDELLQMAAISSAHAETRRNATGLVTSQVDLLSTLYTKVSSCSARINRQPNGLQWMIAAEENQPKVAFPLGQQVSFLDLLQQIMHRIVIKKNNKPNSNIALAQVGADVSFYNDC
jgi:hypothetical protein